MPKLSCIIIEDEKPAQEVLKSYIAKTDWISLESAFDDAIGAIEFLKKREVDFLLLDIEIPGVNGLEFLKILKNPPQVIFTTAYSAHAIEAFELEAVDYLMKPVSFDRFLKAVNRITSKPETNQVHQLQNIVTETSFAFFNVNKVMVKVKFDDILYIESMREYVYINMPDNKVITKIGIGEMEKMLTPNFLRAHRSFLVNTNKITAYNAEEIFVGKNSIPIGINFKKMVEAVLRGKT